MEKWASDIRDLDRRSRVSLVSQNSMIDIKLIMYRMTNYLNVDYFAEEFTAFEGIKVIIEVIHLTSGQTRVIS